MSNLELTVIAEISNDELREKILKLVRADEQGLLFDVTKQHDLEGIKKIIRCLIENYTGVPIPVEDIGAAVDILVM